MTDVLPPPSGPDSSPPTVEVPAGTPELISDRPGQIPARMTFEEFLDWDHEGIRAEWVDGEVVIVSPVRLDHQRVLQFCIVCLPPTSIGMGLATCSWHRS